MEVEYTTWEFVGPLINPICSVLMRKETIELMKDLVCI